MNIAFISKNTKDYDSSYSENSNMIHFGRELSKYSRLKIFIFGSNERKKIAPNFEMVPFKYFAEIQKEIDLFYVGTNHGIDTLKNLNFKDWHKVYAKHFTFNIWNDFVKSRQEFFMDNCRFFDVTTKEALVACREFYPNSKNVFNIENAAPEEIPERGTNPFKYNDKPIALYLGSLGENCQVDKIKHLYGFLKDKCYLYVVSHHSDSPYVKRNLGGLKNCFILPKVENDLIWNYLFYSDVGIGFNGGSPLSPFSNSVTLPSVAKNDLCKIYYYMRAGLPVVIPDNITNAWMVRELSVGRVIKTINGIFEMSEFSDYVYSIACKKIRDDFAIENILNGHTYRHRVREFLIKTGI